MVDKKDKSDPKIEKVLEKIEMRLESLEQKVQGLQNRSGEAGDEDASMESCGLPFVPPRELETGIDPGREALIRSIEKKWTNGTELKYYFFDEGNWGGSAGQQQVVRDAFKEWKDVRIGLSFTEIPSAEQADIRIGFARGEGSWSYVGRDIWSRPTNERTMNFGWTLQGQDGRDTALHEIGHTLGFHHEQQNPFAPIVWDVDAVYAYFTGPPNNWSREKTFHNVLKVLDPNSVEGSEWDANSIMQYSIRAGLIRQPEQYRNGLTPDPGLSAVDIERVRLFYPETDDDDLEALKLFASRQLDLAPAEQANFSIKVEATRQYTIQTFGASDTVMVLFEEVDGRLEHFAADDDSGWQRNARLNVRLVRGRKYVLRIRLYFSESEGSTAVMMW